MKKNDLRNRLAELEDELMREECKDRGYDFRYAKTLKDEIREIEKMLAEK